MEKLIKDFDFELVEPGCAPGSGRWGAVAKLSDYISEVLPYLNAIFPLAQYDHEEKVLILKEDEQWYALRPNEIRIARVENVEEGTHTIRKFIEKINDVWERRGDIAPRIAQRKLPSVIEIFKLLPRTNCGQCGYSACMAYAADLGKGKTKIEACVPLLSPDSSQKRQRIIELISDTL